jgi:hypothetical protein
MNLSLKLEKNSKTSKRGNFALYAIVFLMVGVVLSIFIFFPQFLNMQSGIYNITCREIKRKVQTAVMDHDANETKSIVQTGKLVDLDELKEKGFLAEIQYCPEKGEYRFDKTGKVICTVHEK